jgi:hypothetical protein
MTLKARVKAGRLVLDEATDLPGGTEIELLPLDPGDWLDEDGWAAHPFPAFAGDWLVHPKVDVTIDDVAELQDGQMSERVCWFTP